MKKAVQKRKALESPSAKSPKSKKKIKVVANNSDEEDSPPDATPEAMNTEVDPLSHTDISQVKMASSILSFASIFTAQIAETELNSFGQRFKNTAITLPICVPSPIQRPFAWTDDFINNFFESIGRLHDERKNTERQPVGRFGTLIYRIAEVEAIPSIGTEFEEVKMGMNMVAYTVVDGMHRLTVMHILYRFCLYYLQMCAQNMTDNRKSMHICEELGRRLFVIDQLTFEAFPRLNLTPELMEDHRKWFGFDSPDFHRLSSENSELHKLAERKFEAKDFKYPGQFMRIAHCGTLASDFIRRKFFYTGNSKLPVLSDNQNWDDSFRELNKFIHCMQNYCYVDAVIQYGGSDPKDLTKEFNQLNWWRAPLKWEDVAKSFITSVQIDHNKKSDAMMSAVRRARKLGEIRSTLDNFSYNKRNNKRDDTRAVSNYFGCALYITTEICDREHQTVRKDALSVRIQSLLEPNKPGVEEFDADIFVDTLEEVKGCLVILLNRDFWEDGQLLRKYREYLPRDPEDRRKLKDILEVINVIMRNPVNEALLCICAVLRPSALPLKSSSGIRLKLSSKKAESKGPRSTNPGRESKAESSSKKRTERVNVVPGDQKNSNGASVASREKDWTKVLEYLKVTRSLLLYWIMREALVSDTHASQRRECFQRLLMLIEKDASPQDLLEFLDEFTEFPPEKEKSVEVLVDQLGKSLEIEPARTADKEETLLKKLASKSSRKKPFYVIHYVLLALYERSQSDKEVFMNELDKVDFSRDSSYWTFRIAHTNANSDDDHIGNYGVRLRKKEKAERDPKEKVFVVTMNKMPRDDGHVDKYPVLNASSSVTGELQALRKKEGLWDHSVCKQRIKTAFNIFCGLIRDGKLLRDSAGNNINDDEDRNTDFSDDTDEEDAADMSSDGGDDSEDDGR